MGRPRMEKPFLHSPAVRRVADALELGYHVHLIYLDLARFGELERAYGQAAASGLLASVETALAAAVAEVLPEGSLLGLQNLWGDDFVIYLATVGPPPAGWLDGLTSGVVQALRRRLQGQHRALAALQVHSAHAAVAGAASGAASLVYQAVRGAMQAAKGAGGEEAAAGARRELEALLAGRALTSVYQPIIRLATGEVLGWEALARGPAGSRLHGPDALFRLAGAAGMTWALERACRQAALAGLGALGQGQKLFLNVNADSLNDPQFISGETLALIQARQLEPQNVVFEITERTSIRDFAIFRRVLEHYRHQGYLVAVDDAGAGYSSLQAIAELRPDFVKLDSSLVKDLPDAPVKQAIIETFVTLAAKTGCTLVAEGVETAAELALLAALGVPYGQGYFLARPAAPPPELAAAARRTIAALNGQAAPAAPDHGR